MVQMNGNLCKLLGMLKFGYEMYYPESWLNALLWEVFKTIGVGAAGKKQVTRGAWMMSGLISTLETLNMTIDPETVN